MYGAEWMLERSIGREVLLQRLLLKARRSGGKFEDYRVDLIGGTLHLGGMQCLMVVALICGSRRCCGGESTRDGGFVVCSCRRRGVATARTVNLRLYAFFTRIVLMALSHVSAIVPSARSKAKMTSFRASRMQQGCSSTAPFGPLFSICFERRTHVMRKNFR